MYLWRSASFSLRSLRKISRKPTILNTQLFLFTVEIKCLNEAAWQIVGRRVTARSAGASQYPPSWFPWSLFLSHRLLWEIVFRFQRSISVTGGSCYKYIFCRDKSFVATNTCLSPQRRVCRDKTRLLSRQKNVFRHFCLDKMMFVATKTPFLWHTYHNKWFQILVLPSKYRC